MTRPLLLAIGGPTASGKTDLAITLAQRFGGEIVNADSRQVYRGMDIGTAKPTTEQRAATPHHMLDVVSPDEDYTLALFARQAHETIAAIAGRGALPILVGGTGLYIRAVARGFSVPEVPPNLALRTELQQLFEAQGIDSLLDRLRTLDPAGAAVIDGKNPRRLIRAIEVSETLGLPFSSLQRQTSPYNTLMIVLEGERPNLFARADQRLDVMVASGFVDEVATLLRHGYGPDLPAMSALGYREVARHLQGDLAVEDAVAATRASTHAFIRRQVTWFRAERESSRIQVDETDPVAAAIGLTERWLDLAHT